MTWAQGEHSTGAFAFCFGLTIQLAGVLCHARVAVVEVKFGRGARAVRRVISFNRRGRVRALLSAAVVAARVVGGGQHLSPLFPSDSDGQLTFQISTYPTQ